MSDRSNGVLETDGFENTIKVNTNIYIENIKKKSSDTHLNIFRYLSRFIHVIVRSV